MILTLDEMKEHLKVQHSEEDAYLEGLILECQTAAEDFCRISFDENAPPAAKLAVKLLVSHYYENRDNPDKQMYISVRMAFENLLYPHRDPDKMF